VQNSRTQGGQRGLGGEGLDDTTTSRYMCTQPFCNKVEFIQNRLAGNCPLTFYYFVGSVFSASSPFTTRACFWPADGQHRWHVRSRWATSLHRWATSSFVDREDLEERDSTTRQRLAICAHSHSVTKSSLSKTVLQETAR
jgi:hypothetical protein